MKNLVFLFLHFLLLFFSSCELAIIDKKPVIAASYKMSQERQKLLSIKTEERRSYFDKLSNTEKVNIFKNKLEQVLQLEWTSEQRAILQEASFLLKPDFYNFPKSDAYLKAEKEWRSKALKVFFFY